MIYYCYELNRKDVRMFLPEEYCINDIHEEKSDSMEGRYSDKFFKEINSKWYDDFLRNPQYVAAVTYVENYTVEIHVAVDLELVFDKVYEDKIKVSFPECEIVSKKEVSIEGYKKAMEANHYDRNYSKIFDRLHIDYADSVWEPLPFDLDEIILDNPKLTKKKCKEKAREILGSDSFYEEIDRIYSRENKRKYYGHPVHYMISAGDWGAAEDIYRLLMNALATNKRLISNRISILKNIAKGSRYHEDLEKYVRAAKGGTVVIELNSEQNPGQCATDLFEFVHFFGKIMEEEKRDTLFIFVEIAGESIQRKDVLNHIFAKADFVQITEGSGTYEQAKNYLLELVKNVDFIVDDKSDVMDYLPDAEQYTVSDIFHAYNTWYGSGLKNHVYKAYKEKKSFKVKNVNKRKRPYEQLQEMIGLTDVKAVVDQIIATSKLLKIRESMGLRTDDVSLHMLFSGNPGTAKTTVAQLLAQILKSEDVITSGRFVECGRQDLVGKYVGWTAKIVEEKFKQAKGGILFIDEAYALIDKSNSFGAEAVNTITLLMERYRREVLVIFAGYPDKMTELVNQNEGIKSRIAFHLNFPDYTGEELTEILQLMCKNKKYFLDEDAIPVCREILEKGSQEENFGNGRYARNVLEQAILRQSNRIMTSMTGEDVSKEEVCRLKKEDFQMPDSTEKKTRKIGFCA